VLHSAVSVRRPDWVSKTDLTRYLRCPYAFHLLDRGLVPVKDTLSEPEARRIAEGVAFHAAVEAVAPPRVIEPAELLRVFAHESIRHFNLQVFENPKLQIYGKPDAIDTAEGALVPVEAKSHKTVQRMDELELAFYWLLLEPLRTRHASPCGRLLLRRGGTPEEVEVELHPRRLDQIRQLLPQIREARANGVQPRICGCTVCRGLQREQIERVTLARKDLTRLWGLGRAYAEYLEQIGIGSHEELLAADAQDVVGKLRKRGWFLSRAQVEGWIHHARSYATSRPVVFGDLPALAGSFIALDLEYEPDRIWLIGVCLASQLPVPSRVPPCLRSPASSAPLSRATPTPQRSYCPSCTRNCARWRQPFSSGKSRARRSTPSPLSMGPTSG
jgi:CRISPR/Cas system-associated exonuclease Cas4 (RecB family)